MKKAHFLMQKYEKTKKTRSFTTLKPGYYDYAISYQRLLL
jgi:hypothetical protein